MDSLSQPRTRTNTPRYLYRTPFALLALVLALTLVPIPPVAPVPQAEAQQDCICENGVNFGEVADCANLCLLVDGISLEILPPLCVVPVEEFRNVDEPLTTLGQAGRIFQLCPETFRFGPFPFIELAFPNTPTGEDLATVQAFFRLERQVLDELMSDHHIPASDEAAALRYARGDLRARLFDRLVGIAKLEESQRTPDDERILDAYAALVRKYRLKVAQTAKSFYDIWASDPTGFVPPEGFTYTPGSACFGGLGGLFASCSPPSLEEFKAYGADVTFNRLRQSEPAGALIAAETLRGLWLLGGMGTAALAFGLTLTFLLVSTVAEGTLLFSILAPVFPHSIGFAGGGIPAATAGAVAGAVGIVIVAIAIAVLQGIQVFEDAEIPIKLQEAVTQAQAPVDMHALVQTGTGEAEFFSVFTETTLRSDNTALQTKEYEHFPGPTDRLPDAMFRVTNEAGNEEIITEYIRPQVWPKDTVDARFAGLSGAWFHLKLEGDPSPTTPVLSLSAPYLDWNGEMWTVTRLGEQFLHIRDKEGASTGAPAETMVNNEIRYLDYTGQRRIAQVVPPNQPPSVVGVPTVAGAVPEGTGLEFTAEAFDPDDDPLTFTWDFGDGSNIVTTENVGVTHTYTDNAIYTVTVTANDNQESNNTGSDTFPVVVANVPPIATFEAPSQANEGNPFLVSLINPSDPSLADTAAGFTYTFNCPQTSDLLIVPGEGSELCKYPDNGSFEISGTIADKDGGTNVYTQPVTINNVAPSATFTAPSEADEGSSFNISLTNPSDPSAADTAAGFTYNLHCVNTSGFPSQPGGDTALCQYPDNGSVEVSGTIADKDGGTNTYTQTVTINNVAPTVSPLSPLSAPEGSAVTVPSAAFGDPALAADDYTCLVNFGDGSTDTQPAAEEPVVKFPPFPSPGHCPDFTHTYADNGTFQVTVTVKDDDAGEGSQTVDSSITNVAPVATFNAPSQADEGGAFSISLTNPQDPSTVDTAAGFTFDLNCVNTSEVPNQPGAESWTCQYPDNGSFEVSGTIADKDGGTTPYTRTVAINNVAPTATFTATAEIFQGELSILAFLDSFDPSPADTAAGFGYAFDCTNDGTLEVTDGSEASFDCEYPTAGSFTAHGTITDKDGGVTSYTADITVLSPQQAVATISTTVQTLAETGVVNGGQANALTVKLEKAIKQMDKGKSKVATNMLKAFINQVTDLVNEGHLTPEEGQELIDLANRVILSTAVI